MLKFLDACGNNVDVEMLMDGINNYFMYNNEDGLFLNSNKYSEKILLQKLKENLCSINQAYNYSGPMLRMNPGIINKLKYCIKRIIRKAINWYILDIHRKQVEFNGSMVRYENESFQLIQQLLQENRQLKKDVMQLQNRVLRQVDASWYLRFEDRFRGDDFTIINRLEKYLKYLKNKEGVFEIGCGRGEFLNILKRENIKAFGVDTNAAMVELCKKKGLDAEVGDGIKVLSQQKDNSLGAVAAIQVVEHLSLYELRQLVDEAYNKLKNDGVIIIETVNPLALGVFCYGFYIDPTHTQPVHPALMKFMLEDAGFKVDEVQFDEYFPEEYHIPIDESMGETTKIAFDKINRQLYDAQDYYLIGRK